MNAKDNIPFPRRALEEASLMPSFSREAEMGSQWRKSSYGCKRLCFGTGLENHSRQMQGLRSGCYDNRSLKASASSFDESNPGSSVQLQTPQHYTPCDTSDLPGVRKQSENAYISSEAPVLSSQVDQSLWPSSSTRDDLNASLPGFQSTRTPTHFGQRPISLPSLEYFGRRSNSDRPLSDQLHRLGG